MYYILFFYLFTKKNNNNFFFLIFSIVQNLMNKTILKNLKSNSRINHNKIKNSIHNHFNKKLKNRRSI